MSKYLEELPHQQAMAVFYDPDDLEPRQHIIATGDFMGMAKHNIACPVCFDAHAVIHRDVSPGRYKQTIQPCHSCADQGYVIARLPRLLRRWFWWVRP